MATTTLPEPEFMDEKQTAAKVSMTPGALRLARHRGVGLPYTRIGTRIRYRVSDIEAYLAANTVRPAT